MLLPGPHRLLPCGCSKQETYTKKLPPGTWNNQTYGEVGMLVSCAEICSTAVALLLRWPTRQYMYRWYVMV